MDSGIKNSSTEDLTSCKQSNNTCRTSAWRTHGVSVGPLKF